MKNRWSLLSRYHFIALLALTCTGIQGSGQENRYPGKPRIAVAKVDSVTSNFQDAWGFDLANKFIESLVQLGKFIVLETVALDSLQNEQSLVQTGEAAQDESWKNGNWDTADYVFVSKVVRFGSEQSGFGIEIDDPRGQPGGGLGPRPDPRGRGPGGPPQVRPPQGPNRGPGGPAPAPHKAPPPQRGPHGDFGPLGIPFGFGESFKQEIDTYTVEIAWRIIDITTRAVVAAGTGTGECQSKKFKIGGFGGKFDLSKGKTAQSGYGQATAMAIANIMVQVHQVNLPERKPTVLTRNQDLNPTPLVRNVTGAVLAVNEGVVCISLGSELGFKLGDKVKVYRPLEVKNKNGEVVTTTHKLVTEITLTEVQANTSLGTCTSAVPIEEGWVVADAAVDLKSVKASSTPMSAQAARNANE